MLKFKSSIQLVAALLVMVALVPNADAKPKKAKKKTTTSVVATPTPVASPILSATPMPSPDMPIEAAPVATPEPTPDLSPTATPVSVVPVEQNTNLESSTSSNFYIGPYATVLAFPRPLSAGVEVRAFEYLGISSGYGYFPELSVSGTKLKITGWDVRAKVYPFGGSFFLGLGYGNQKFTGSQTQVISGIQTTGIVNQDNAFITPHIGWNWGSEKGGFFMGIDLGVQLSLKRDTVFTTDVTNPTVLASPEYANLRKDVLDAAETIGKTPLPLISLIKVGYLF